jgi:TonB family protein
VVKVRPARHQPLIKPEVLEAIRQEAEAQHRQGDASQQAWNQYLARQGQPAPEAETPPTRTWGSKGGMKPKQVSCPMATLLEDEVAMVAAARVDRVRVRVLFDETGKTLDTKVVKSSGNPVLDGAAAGTAYNCVVVPGKKRGVAKGGQFDEFIRLR